jgi:hypothetical protein
MKLIELFNPNISKYYFIYLKIFFILYLVISSILVKNTKFINSNKTDFVYELLLSFVCMAVIPILIMSYFRQYPIFDFNTLKRIMMFGILFCGIHSMLELNGFYSIMYDSTENFIEKFTNIFNLQIEHLDKNEVANNKIKEELSKKIDKEYNKLNIITNNTISLISVTFISFFIMMLYIVLTGIIHGLYGDNFGLSYKLLFVEGLLIGIFSAVPILFYAYNRSGKVIHNNSIFETLLLALKIFILHYSGFYLVHFSKQTY